MATRKLTTLKVRHATAPGRDGDGNGLYLNVRPVRVAGIAEMHVHIDRAGQESAGQGPPPVMRCVQNERLRTASPMCPKYILHHYGRYGINGHSFRTAIPPVPRTFAYVRVSTTGQTTENQIQEIDAAGFKVDPRRVVSETVSGSSSAPHPSRRARSASGWWSTRMACPRARSDGSADWLQRHAAATASRKG